jgi:hypothetical protein
MGASTIDAQTADTTTDRFTNRDLMLASERDRRLWLNAFMAGAANAIALRDVEVGRCLTRWYDDEDRTQLRLIEASFDEYPNNLPAEIIFALARRACPDLVEGT